MACWAIQVSRSQVHLQQTKINIKKTNLSSRIKSYKAHLRESYMQWLCYARLICLLGTSSASTHLLIPPIPVGSSVPLHGQRSVSLNLCATSSAWRKPFLWLKKFTRFSKCNCMSILSDPQTKGFLWIPCVWCIKGATMCQCATPSLSHHPIPSAPGEVWVGASRKTVTMTHQQNTFHLLREVHHCKDLNGRYVSTVIRAWATYQLDFEETY